MTQRELGRLADLDPTYISKLENDADRPGEQAVHRLAAALGADLDELLSLAGKAAPRITSEVLSDPQLGSLVRRLPNLKAMQRSAVFSAAGVPRRNPLLVDATDLVEWAHRRDAQALLPQLVQRLILATTDRARRVAFRSGEGINLSGWDGVVESEGPHPFVPIGVSGWELSTRSDETKLKSDLAARTANTGEFDPAVSTFVFVTPRRVVDRDSRAARLRRGTSWRAVRILDADDLAAWLVQAPAVHAWFSSLLGKLPEGARSLDAAWREWSEACSPPLSAALTLAGRRDAQGEVLRALKASTVVEVVRADSAQEAIAFVAATVVALPSSEQDAYWSRAVVCDTPEAWRAFSASAGSLLLLAPFAPPDAALAAGAGHTVLIAGGHDLAATAAIELPRPDREAVREALTDMLRPLADGTRDRQVEELATLGRRSLLALRRRLAISPALHLPPWSEGAGAHDLVPALLAGAWDEGRPGDRDVLADLADQPYEVVATRCAWFSVQPDPPLRGDGTSWIVTSRDDLWTLLAPQLSASDLAALARAAETVLGADDPALTLPRNERWLAGVRGLTRSHSDLLRQGLAEGILYLATSPATVAGIGGQVRSDGIVGALLAAGNNDATAMLWASLGDVLPTLAEASPDRFLDAVDRALLGDEPVLGRLMATSDSDGPLAPPPETTGLLWALETLAWSPAFLGGAARALARLDRMDPGSKTWANRPANSLRAIFLPWHPATAAPLGQRLDVLDALRRRYPDTAWHLLVGLLPRLQDWAEPTHTPARREWPSGAGAVTYAEVFESADRVAERVVEDAGRDPHRWGELADALPALPPSARQTILRGLEGIDASGDDDDWATLGERLRTTVAEHRRSPQARWRLPDEEVERLELVAQRLQSPDPVRAVAWLFDAYPALAVPLTDDRSAYHAELDAQRARAIAGVLAGGGLGEIERLAALVKEPFVLGTALAAAELPAGSEEHLVEQLRSGTLALSMLGRGFVAGRQRHDGWAWVEATLKRIAPRWKPVDLAKFLATLRPVSRMVWTWAAELGEETEHAYWSTADPRWLEDAGEVGNAAQKLIEIGRCPLAVDLLATHLERLVHPDSDQVVLGALRGAASDESTAAGDLAMFAWEVARLLDFLEAGPKADWPALAELEFLYLPLLRHGDRPKVLHRQLASDPEFFVQVLAMAFRADNEERRELAAEERSRARLAYELLTSWQQLPGGQDTGKVDAVPLRDWVARSLALSREHHRGTIGAQQVGRVLRYAPPGTDGIWPAEPVRDLLEELEDPELELGLQIEIENSRGVTMRGPTDGGAQELELAQRYRTDAARLRDTWSRVASVLLHVAESYEHQANFEDDRADLTQDTWP